MCMTLRRYRHAALRLTDAHHSIKDIPKVTPSAGGAESDHSTFKRAHAQAVDN